MFIHFKKEDGTIEKDIKKGLNSYTYVYECENCKVISEINYRSFKRRPEHLCKNCKREKTNLKKYGVKKFTNREKADQTNLRKYGDKNFTNREKAEITNLRKYGVENVFSSKEFALKIKQTNLKKYGVENISHLQKTHEKRKQTNLERYGNKNFTNQKKREETNLKKYGYKTPLSNKKIRSKSNLSHLEIQKDETFEKLKNIEGFTILNDQYLGQNCVYNIRCETCNEVFTRYIKSTNNALKINCPKCTPCGESSYERELRSFLENLNIEFISNSRDIIKPFEIDVYIPSIKLGIEINGLYWHSEKFKEIDYHYNKYILAKENGIELWQFFEDEWIYQKDIILNKIKLKLGIYEKRIYARKTRVKEVSKKEVDVLLNDHLLGPDRSSIRYGLFYEDEIVSVMTFVRKGDGVILNRYIVKSGYMVVGGFSKLLKYFKDNHNFSFIESFSENRYSYGNVYLKNGFKYDYEVPPDYWYIIGDKRIHKFNFRKNLIKQKFNLSEDIEAFTEKDKMRELGINRVYNAGLTKWVMTLI